MSLTGINDAGLMRPVGINFIPETGFLVLSLDKISYGYNDRPVRYQGRVFAPKQELHITMVSSQLAETVLQFLSNKPDEQHAIEDLIHSTDWRFRKLAEMHHIQEAPGVETIIQMVELPFQEIFFKGLSGILGQGVLLPSTHVTLYMRGTETGIGLPSPAVFETLSQARLTQQDLEPVENPAGGPDLDQGMV